MPGTYLLYLLSLYLSTPNKPVEKDEKSGPTKPTVQVCTPYLVLSPSSVLQSNGLFYDTLTIAFTLPTSIRRLRIASLAINSLLFLAALDLVAEPFYNSASDVIFTRVGAVYPDAVKITLRYPGLSEPVHVVWRQSRVQLWTIGPSVTLTEENDWVNTVTLPQLWPNTAYECMSLKLAFLAPVDKLIQTRLRPVTARFYLIPPSLFLSKHSPTLVWIRAQSSASWLRLVSNQTFLMRPCTGTASRGLTCSQITCGLRFTRKLL